MQKQSLVALSLVASLAVSFIAQAEETAPPVSPWKNETELSVVTVAGNSESESYSVRQGSSYTFDQNVISAKGKFLNTKSVDKTTSQKVDTARQWEAGLRYERLLGEKWGIYIAGASESNGFAGYIQKDSAELGGKYIFTKDSWFAELAYRRTNIYDTAGTKSSINYGRLYTEYKQAITASTAFKMWVEYLHNFTDSSAYVATVEPSLTVMMNSIFSLKMAYNYKYSAGAVTPIKKEDSTLTTSIVASF